MTCETWLEIGEAGSDSLRWRFQVKSHSGSAEFRFVSPITQSAETLLRDYVRDFRSWRARQRDWALTAERTLLQLGRALGDALVDPDYKLLAFCERIAHEGQGKLHVALLADSPELHALPWELLILPDSEYVVSAASAAFVRGAAGSQPFATPARTLDLSAERPLGYLRVGAGRPEQPSTALSTAWNQTGWQGALHYRYATDLNGVNGEPACHILHWVPSEEDSLENASKHLIEKARALGAELLILEANPQRTDFHEVALTALQAGIDNVVVLTDPAVHGWPSDFSQQLLDCLRSGLTVQRAVVETRKRLQRALLEARQGEAEQLHPPQQWHALRHYSRCDVQFFDTPHALVAPESTEAHAALRADLFGFEPVRLPGEAPDLGDAAALALRDAARPGRALIATAAHGGGLTHALHRFALFARANREIERAYYWDLEREAFSPGDILEMVDGSRGQTDRQQVSEPRVLGELAERRELFVLDNVDVLAADEPRLRELLEFATRLAAAGGLCVLGAHEPLAHAPATFSALHLGPLTEVEAVAMVRAIAPNALTLGSGAFTLIELLAGNPLLIARVLPHSSAENLAELQAELTEIQTGDADPNKLVERFRIHRWRALAEPWQRLLSAWLPFEGLYLQTLMLAVDSPGGERSDAGRKLWALLDAPAAASCADAIATLQRAGFATQRGVGACIDRSALRFLRARAPAQTQPELALSLAQLLCEAVSRVLERRNQAVDAVTGHWLEHRAVFHAQIEMLLRSGEYVVSTRAFLNLHALLGRANLAHEAAAWARSVVESAGAGLCTHENAMLGAIWLRIAARARPQPLDGALQEGVQRWTDWLTEGKLSGALLLLAVAFLEKVYDQAGNFAAYRTVAQCACDAHRAAGNTAALVPQLRALAAAEHVLGHSSERDRIEDELIDGFDYAALPEGDTLRKQTLAGLTTARLQRTDDAGAEALIVRLEREWSGDDPNRLAQMLRAELALSRAQLDLAAELFCQLWQAAVSGKQGMDIDAVARRLRQLERELGQERFTALYAEYAGATPTPDALGISFQQLDKVNLPA